MKHGKLIILSIFAIMSFLLLCNNLFAQKQLDWQGERHYDTANQTAVVVSPWTDGSHLYSNFANFK